MTIQEKLLQVQVNLNAPKNLRNTFGNYNYRSCEGILEAVKPLLKEANAFLVLEDNLVEVGGRVFVEAIATFRDAEAEKYEVIKTKAYAELDNHKGMSLDQCTGTASSYARKYALNGLFLIDDAKDSDTDEAQNERKARQEANKKASTTKAAQQAEEQTKTPQTALDRVSWYWNNAKNYDADIKGIINELREGKRLSELDEATLKNIVKAIEEEIK